MFSLSNYLRKLHPAAVVLFSFLLLIVIGTILLKLPFATVSGEISWVDALFTAASAVCVTGLIVVDTGSFYTVPGQIIILCLFQLGGLGVMTLSVAMYRWIRRSISFRHRKIMQDLLTHTPREDILSLVISVFKFTFVIEFIGASLLTVYWARMLPLGEAIFVSVFHAISAFCNAGFSLFSDSLVQYRGSYAVNSIMALLIIFGGIGFPVLYEIEQTFLLKKNRKLSVQTKTVLTTSGLLILGGALIFGLLEHAGGNTGGTIGDNSVFPLRQQILSSLFQSITARTAGFNTLDIANVGDAGAAMLLLLMFVGASPGSCGGGVKTTTLAILAASSYSKIKGHQRVNMYKKSVPQDTVIRSLILIVLAIGIIGTVFFLLLVTNGNAVEGTAGIIKERSIFLPFLFETVSAFGTVGLSMGVTSLLNSAGKLLIICLMIIGRVGVLTFSYIFTGYSVKNGVEYSEENIMIG